MPTNFKDVRPLLAPSSIAIVGASPKEQTWPARIFRNLQRFAYTGQVFPVNPKYDNVWGQNCYANLRALPTSADLAIVIVPAEAVLSSIEEAIAAGVKAAVILSGGFGESGNEEGLERAAKLSKMCAAAGITLCGPNCLGFISVPYRVMAMTDARVPVLELGGLSLVSQSGGIMGGFCRTAADRGFSFSYLISSGNELDTELADYIAFLCDDPHTKVIAAFVEGIRDPRKFLIASEYALAKGKPIIALKIGRSARGVAAAMAHTGALAGRDEIFDAVCKDNGIIRVNDLDTLLNTADYLLHSKLPKGNRLGFLTFSGGLKGMIVDIAEDTGTRLEELSEQSATELNELLPVGTSVGNPLDSGWGGLSSQEIYLKCVRTMLADPNVDCLAIQEELPRDASRADKESNLLALAEIAKEEEKPLVAFSMVSHSVTDYGREFRKRCGLAFLQEVGKTMVSANAAIAYNKALQKYQYGQKDEEATEKVPRSMSEGDREDIKSILRDSKGPVDEFTGARLLKQYGIRFPAMRLARTEEEAVQAAESLGFPVVLKILAEGLTHKSDAGGVLLNLRTAEAVRQGFESILTNVHRWNREIRVQGALVQQMVPKGLEVIIGGLVDPQFGPAVMFGLGGVLVEVYKDVVFRMAPVTQETAAEMIGSIKGVRLLRGYRGQPAADEEFLADILVRLSHFMADHSDRLQAVEINPLIALPPGQGGVAVDTLIVPAIR